MPGKADVEGSIANLCPDRRQQIAQGRRVTTALEGSHAGWRSQDGHECPTAGERAAAAMAVERPRSTPPRNTLRLPPAGGANAYRAA